MAATRVVYTAITNGHAQLSARPDVPDTDFVCYSDVPIDRSDWQVRPIESAPQLSPRMRAKFHKVFPPIDYEWSVWVDGSYVLRVDDNARNLMDDLVQRSPSGFGLHRHSDRDCLFDEAVHSMELPKCRDEVRTIQEQALHYAVTGHPRNWGLWAAGLMCRRRDQRITAIMDSWWNELMRWSWRDQISLSYVLHKAQFRPDEWPWPLFPISNPYMAGWKFNPI